MKGRSHKLPACELLIPPVGQALLPVRADNRADKSVCPTEATAD